MPSWHTPATIRGSWANAPQDDAQLQELLDVAKGQCLAWAPLPATALDGGESVENPPTRHRFAQRLQAQALWEASKSAPSDSIGGEGYGARIYDMGATIKRVLIPPSPTVGLVG